MRQFFVFVSMSVVLFGEIIPYRYELIAFLTDSYYNEHVTGIL